MTANQYLSKIKWYELQIDTLNDEIKKRSLPGVSGTDYVAPRVNSYPGDTIGGYAAWSIDLLNELIEKKARYWKLRNDAIQRIERLDNPDYADILRRRYLFFQTWGTIADEMLYSKMHIFRLKKRALQAFEEANNDLFCDDQE